MATIQKRGNSYRIMVSAGYTAEGKQLRKGMTWTPAPGMTEKQTQKELERQAVLFEEKVKSGLYLDGNIRFQDFAERWFRDYAEGHLRERTLDRYRGLAERTYQAIGHIRICLLYTSLLVTPPPGGGPWCEKPDHAPLCAVGANMVLSGA